METFWSWLENKWIGQPLKKPSEGTNKLARGAIGLLAMALGPLCWVIGLPNFQGGKLCYDSSISHYYYYLPRDYFEGILFMVAVFLITYKGYLRIDFIYTFVMGVLALGVMTFPCSLFELEKDRIGANIIGMFGLGQNLSDSIHMTCAVTLFVLLAIYVLVFFTRTKRNGRIRAKTGRLTGKGKRNIVYFVCGFGMFADLAYCAFRWAFNNTKRWTFDFNATTHEFFWIEMVMLILFGFAWLVKANILPGLGDKPDESLRVHSSQFYCGC